MKISVNWLKDYVKLPEISNKELAEIITLSVCEVEGYTETGTHLSTVVTAKIISSDKHPNADKLKLLVVTDGNTKYEIVCGADNFLVENIVPLALVGTVMPGSMTIKKSKIRNVVSEGMLCAEDELGLSDNHDGLLIFPDETPVGTSLAKLYPDVCDCILEIDNKSITHRPDLWGHYGFSRELSVIFDVPLAPYTTYSGELNNKTQSSKISVSIAPETKAKRFSSLEITGLLSISSPEKIQHRLHRVGSKAINNLVDVTNYVMLDCGQPMHAFDAKEIPGNMLHVECAKPGESLMTLQHKSVSFVPDDVVIYDKNGPTAVAGIIGGERSGISDKTTEMLLEAGCWDAVKVRQTSGRINTRTEASQHYEKSLDPELTVESIKKALEILLLTNPDLKIRGNLFDYRSSENAPISIQLKHSKIDRVLGFKTVKDKNIKILTGLGFLVKSADDELNITVPSWRATKDVSIGEDIIEEIGRIYGYNTIKEEAPLFPIEKPKYNHQRLFERKVKEILAANGMFEIFTYPMNARKEELKFGLDEIEPNELLNPVVRQWHQMRTVLLPGFLKAIWNAQKTDIEFNYFEIGKIYGRRDNLRFEQNRLIMAFSSENDIKELFKQAKRVINRLFSLLNIPIIWKQGTQIKPYFHPNYNAALISGNEELGQVFTFGKKFMEQEELKPSLFIAEFDFEKMYAIYFKTEPKKLGELPKYPAMKFDISILVNDTDPFLLLAGLIRKSDRFVEQVNYKYEYMLKELPGKKSLTVEIIFRDPDKTLGSEEATRLRDHVIKFLDKNGYQLRT